MCVSVELTGRGRVLLSRAESVCEFDDGFREANRLKLSACARILVAMTRLSRLYHEAARAWL